MFLFPFNDILREIRDIPEKDRTELEKRVFEAYMKSLELHNIELKKRAEENEERKKARKLVLKYLQDSKL